MTYTHTQTEPEYRHEADPYEMAYRHVAGLRVLLSRLRGVASLDELGELRKMVALEIQVAEERTRRIDDLPWRPVTATEAHALREYTCASLACAAVTARSGPPNAWERLAGPWVPGFDGTSDRTAVYHPPTRFEEWAGHARDELGIRSWAMRPDAPWGAYLSAHPRIVARGALRCCAAWGLLPDARIDMGAAGLVARLIEEYGVESARESLVCDGLGNHVERWIRDARVALDAWDKKEGC